MDAATRSISKRKRQIIDVSTPEKWGSTYFWPFFAVAAAMAAIAFSYEGWLESILQAPSYPWIRGVLLVLNFIAAVVALIVAHVSYPRIHNLKVLLLGYLTFLLHGAYVLVRFAELFHPVVRSLAEENSAFTLNFYGLVFMNLLLLLAIPSFTKYRFARSFLLYAAVAEGVFCLYLLLGFFGHAPVPAFSVGKMGWGLPCLFAVAYTFLSVKTTKGEYNFGGALAGLACVYCVPAAARMGAIPVEHAFVLEEIGLVLASGLVLAAMVGNWLMRMSHRLYYDPLTKIYNREYCDAILEERSNVLFSMPSSVAIFDVDHFKKVNDTYGHAMGDRVLQYVAQCMSRQVVPHGIACRYGGEEIVVFFPDLPLETAREICSVAHHAVKSGGVESGRRKIRVTISAGVAELSSRYPTLSDALKAADKALYEAKNTGRDKVLVASGKRRASSR